MSHRPEHRHPPEATAAERIDRLPPGRGLLACATLAYLALALYGSLVPFHFDARQTVANAWQHFQHVPYLKLTIHSRADWVANILLFVPLAFLASATLSADRHYAARCLAAVVVWPVCIALAVGIEFVQLFFPPRTVSQNDMLAESIGASIGCGAWLVWGQGLLNWIRRLVNVRQQRGLPTLLLPAWYAALVLIHVMPLDLTISPVEVYHKFREGRVHLLPFQTQFASPLEALQKYVWLAVYFAPLGMILAHWPAAGWQQASRWAAVLGAGVAASGLIEFLQLFVHTRSCDVTDVILGTAYVLVGWWLAVRYSRVLPHGAETFPPVSVHWKGVGGHGLHLAWLLASLAWCAVLAGVFFYPFDFQISGELVRTKLARFSLIPFAEYYRGSEYQAFDQLLQKSLFALPLGVLLGLAWPAGAVGWQRVVPLGVSALVFAGLEAGQFFLPSKYPSVTDPLVRLVAVWLGLKLTARFLLDDLRMDARSLATSPRTPPGVSQ